MENLYALLPAPTTVSKPFWKGCNEETLLFQRCSDCKKLIYYPRHHCPKCGSDQLGWEQSSGQGTIWSFTTVEVSFYGPQWESQIPYTVTLVDLDEGVRMLSRLVGEKRAEVSIGKRVTVKFATFEGQKLPYFELS